MILPDRAVTRSRFRGFLLVLLSSPLFSSGDEPRKRSGEALVDVSKACPGVVIDLRYATPRNLTGAPIYPENARALLRHGVAQRLNRAQTFLRARGFGLKVWDAYRPFYAQERLWAARPDPNFVGNPARGGSLHCWGVAVDVTLVDDAGAEMKMPTGFDEFGPAAARRYTGGDLRIAANLALLQEAMGSAGFLLMRDEWWHFAAKDYREYGPVTDPVKLGPSPAQNLE